MRWFLVVIFGGFALSAAPASAKCTGGYHSMQLGMTVETQMISDGGPCHNRVLRSNDPIYGSLIVAAPKHGSLSSAGRISLIYRPQAGFKGDDHYAFKWVGKRDGVTPDAVTVNVTVTVR